jgi:hypothetical protein
MPHHVQVSTHVDSMSCTLYCEPNPTSMLPDSMSDISASSSKPVPRGASVRASLAAGEPLLQGQPGVEKLRYGTQHRSRASIKTSHLNNPAEAHHKL